MDIGIMDAALDQIWTLNLIALLGGFSTGLSGFGAPLIMVPLLTIWFPFTIAVPLTMLLTLVATSPLLLGVHRHIRLGRESYIALVFSLGAILGVQFLVLAPEDLLRNVLGIVLLAYAGYVFLRKPAPQTQPAWTYSEAGRLGGAALSQGALAGAIGGGVLPLVPYLTLRYPAAQVRAILIVVFSVGTVVQTVGYAVAGLIDGELGLMALAALPGLLIGLGVGTVIHGLVPARLFTRAVATLLIFPALNMLGAFGWTLH